MKKSKNFGSIITKLNYDYILNALSKSKLHKIGILLSYTFKLFMSKTCYVRVFYGIIEC